MGVSKSLHIGWKECIKSRRITCHNPEPSPITWLFVSTLQEKLPKANVFEGKAAEGTTSLHGLGLNLYNLLDAEKVILNWPPN